MAAVVGCNGGGRSIVPVSGRVTLDGKPLSGGSVSFQPAAAAGQTSAGRGSAAYCDEDGRFTLTTIDGQPGAVVAEHRVRIYAARTQQSSANDSGIVGAAYKEPVPERYNYQTTLTFTVPADGTDEANFALTTED